MKHIFDVSWSDSKNLEDWVPITLPLKQVQLLHAVNILLFGDTHYHHLYM